MPLMAPQQPKPQVAPPAQAVQPQGGNPNMIPSNIGSSEPDDMPQQPDASQVQQPNPQTQEIQQRLDELPDHDKQFLSQYLTPEFVYAIGLVSGPEAAQYLNQFTDQNKVLVPVSRQEAARIQEAVKQGQQQGQGQPQQGVPQGAPQQAQGQPAQPQQGAPQMKPQMQTPQQPQHPLPNGVTPAPMQGGVMAPRV